MKTPSHALIGYVAAKMLNFDRRQIAFCVVGTCLADLPLMLAYIHFWLLCFWQVGHYDAAFIQARMDAIYFSNSWLLIAHNLFHSPISIGYLALIIMTVCARQSVVRRSLLAYLFGSLSHSLLDIISHVNDGPLILWPLNDELRIVGWFSHWNVVVPLMFELLAILVLMVFAYSRRMD